MVVTEKEMSLSNLKLLNFSS